MNRISLVFAAVALASVACYAQPGTENTSYQLGYMSNLDKADAVVNFTNFGSTFAFGLPAPATTFGNLCANVYVFDPQEELISCCSCLVTPNGLNSLSAKGDLISNTLTPATPTSIVVKIVGTLALDVNGTFFSALPDTFCNPTTINDPTKTFPVNALLAWGTNNHVDSTGGLALTELKFRSALLLPPAAPGATPNEIDQLATFCRFNQINGTGFGVCKACINNGRGAAKH